MAPLLSSSDTCVLFVDPRKQHLDNLDQAIQKQLDNRFQLLANAASAAGVPCHFVFERDASNQREWLAFPKAVDEGRVQSIAETEPAWQSPGLASALATDNRSRLVICGFWLETRVSFLALHALSAGFDLFLLTDAAPPYAEHARDPSSLRLWQAGATPITTRQLIAEWAEQATDQKLREDLCRLLRPD